MDFLRQLSKYFSFSSKEALNGVSLPKDSICYIKQMPNELLFKLFEYLDFISLMRAQSVCRHWNHLIGSMIENETNIVITDFKSPEKDYDFTIQKVFELKETLKVLKTKKSYEKISSTIISKHFTLKALTLQFNEEKAQKNVLKLVTDSCTTELFELQIRTMSDLTVSTKEVDHFCRRFPNIRVFRLIAFHVFIKQKALHIMVKVWQKLETLCVRHMSFRETGNYKMIGYNGLPFRDISPNIERIQLNSYVFDIIAVRYIQLNGVHGIKELTIDFLKDFTSLEVLNKCCPEVHKLKVSIHPGILCQSNVYDLWSTFGSFKNLKNLGVSYGGNKVVICPLSIRKLANGSQITKLSIGSGRMASDTIQTIAQYLPKLEKLSLMYIDFVTNTDQSVAPISQMQHLKNLRLHLKPEVSEQTLISLLTDCPNIDALDLPFNTKITQELMHLLIYRANSQPEDVLRFKVSQSLRKSFKKFDELIPKNLIIYYSKPKQMYN